MSTRGVVARTGEREGEFVGRYTHSDSMPMSRGPLLIQMLKQEFKGDLKKLTAYLIDDHQAGWSSLIPEHRACYCHPRRAKGRDDFRRRAAEPAQTITQKHLDARETDIEWLYVFDVEKNSLAVRDVRHGAEFFLSLAEPVTDSRWTEIECGGEAENWARCSHYGWVHRLTPKTSNLSTQTWLERRPLKFHDAIAFMVHGKRVKATGSGGNSDYLQRRTGQNLPRNCWVSSVIAGNGKRLEVPVAKILPDGEYAPLPGIAFVYPPTKNNPSESVVSA